jgi:multisite-specific tRNA:(cytosine-C5)-methyltransferase
MVRNAAGKPVRSVYLTSPSIKQVLEANDYERIRLISCGVKVFTRQDQGKDGYPCKWRLLSEGIKTMRPYMGEKRVVRCGVATLKRLLGPEAYPRFHDFEEERFVESVEALENGSAIVEVDPGEEAGGRRVTASAIPERKHVLTPKVG